MGDHFVGLILPAILRKHQKRASQPLFAVVKKLVDQVLFNTHISPQHISNEVVGEGTLRAENLDHFLFLDDE